MSKSIEAFRTPVVREMTDDEYREHGRRVIASLIRGSADTRAARAPAPASIAESPITVLRIRGGGESRTILSVEGTTVERVIRPSPSLVGADG